MKNILKKILSQIVSDYYLINYYQAIYILFCGDKLGIKNHLGLLETYFIDYTLLYEILDGDNIMILSISDEKVEVVIFDEDYIGVQLQVGFENNKLKLVSCIEIDSDDPIYDSDELDEENIMI